MSRCFMDYTGVFNGYITDMTRIFVIGDLDPELKDALCRFGRNPGVSAG